MSRQSLTKLVLVGSLGLLAFFFAFAFLAFLSRGLRPSHTDFVFAISHRTFRLTTVTWLLLLALVLFFSIRGLRRRNLN
jgi:hypothetical protein